MPRRLSLFLLLSYLLVHGGAGDWSVQAEAGGLCCVDTAQCCCAPEAQVEASGSCLMAAPCAGDLPVHMAVNKRVPHLTPVGLAPAAGEAGVFGAPAAPRTAYSLPASTPDPVPITPVFS